MKYIQWTMMLLLLCNLGTAQEAKKKKKNHINVNTNGVYVSTNESDEEDNDADESKPHKSNDDPFRVRWAIVDVGFNGLDDRTDYNSAGVQNFLNVPASLKNKNLLRLDQDNSIFVDVYFFMTRLNLLNHERQKIFLVNGLGLQLYNFRYNKSVNYIADPAPGMVLDTVRHYSKNKLAFDYLNIPVGLTFKTKLGKRKWLVYGAGLTFGYRLASWTKNVTDENGTEKRKDKFDFRDFNTCVTAELGIDNVVRLFASYQLTPLQENGGLQQYPFCIGLRINGM